MTPIVIVGGGGHAKVVAAIVARLDGYRIVGYTALAAGSPSRALGRYLGDDGTLAELAASATATAAALGVGVVALDSGRAALQKRLVDAGLALPVILAPGAVVDADALVGDGTVIMDGVVVNPGAIIGECCIINTHATVEHDCRIGSLSHIAPGAILCGGVEVGSQSIVGAGACVLPGIRIADRCFVGAGSTVTQSLCEPGVYAGSPATRIAQ